MRWPRNTLYPLKLALTLSTSGGRSVGIVRLRTKAPEFFFVLKQNQNDRNPPVQRKIQWRSQEDVEELKTTMRKLRQKKWCQAKLEPRIWNAEIVVVFYANLLSDEIEFIPYPSFIQVVGLCEWQHLFKQHLLLSLLLICYLYWLFICKLIIQNESTWSFPFLPSFFHSDVESKLV
jgi:hypothetical protein